MRTTPSPASAGASAATAARTPATAGWSTNRSTSGPSSASSPTRAIIGREIADILDLGIDLRLNTRVDDLDEVFEEGFDAVLISVGAHEGIRLPIPGADLDGVLINTRFLRDVRLGKYRPSDKGLIVNADA